MSLHGRKRTRERRENEEMPPFAKRLIDRKRKEMEKKKIFLSPLPPGVRPSSRSPAEPEPEPNPQFNPVFFCGRLVHGNRS
jgi:hypothetical protein